MNDVSKRDFLLAGAGAALTLAAPAIASAQSARPYRLLVGGGAPLFAWSVSFVAEQMGYYKDEGLQLERIFNNSGPAALTALVSGAAHALLITPGEFIVARSRGQNLKAIMAMSNFSELYFIVSKAYADKLGVNEDSSSEQRQAAVAKFKGIRIGITAPGSQTDVSSRLLLRQAGINPDTDAQLVPLGATVNSLAAMSRGAIDAFVASAPVPELAHRQQDAVRLLKVSKKEFAGLEEAAGHCLLCRGNDLEEKKDIYQSAVRADAKALRLIIQDPKTAGEAAAKSFSAAVQTDLWSTVWDNNKDQFRSPYLPEASLRVWVTKGLVPDLSDPNAPDFPKAIDMQFVAQAVKDIGWNIQP